MIIKNVLSELNNSYLTMSPKSDDSKSESTVSTSTLRNIMNT